MRKMRTFFLTLRVPSISAPRDKASPFEQNKNKNKTKINVNVIKFERCVVSRVSKRTHASCRHMCKIYVSDICGYSALYVRASSEIHLCLSLPFEDNVIIDSNVIILVTSQCNCVVHCDARHDHVKNKNKNKNAYSLVVVGRFEPCDRVSNPHNILFRPSMRS